ncbi:hypothetical protein CVT25_000107 [Psilocybe cyanescens]|uniref:Uncharacterized protein n=1 Tax=Psilocybe cyanescens TaxID=93625 RepID=A0A409XQ53_PSICY|nr:hypothetical protein CVT25_000107 [Psilocybe cyanescens]
MPSPSALLRSFCSISLRQLFSRYHLSLNAGSIRLSISRKNSMIETLRSRSRTTPSVSQATTRTSFMRSTSFEPFVLHKVTETQ